MEENKPYIKEREQPVRPVVPTDDSDEVDLKEILVKLWQQRKFILIVTGLFLLLGIFIAFTSPVKYTAQSVILPQSGRQSSAGSLGSLASIVGVNIGTAVMTEGNISTAIYPQILNSLPFVREVMQTSITIEKPNEKEITLYEYYTNPDYKKINVLATVKKYTIGLPRTIRSAFRPKKPQRINNNATTIVSDNNGIVRISSQEQSVYNAIRGSIQYEYNTKQGVIKLGYIFPEPLAAAQVSEQLYKLLEKYVINYKTEKVQENLAFVEQSYTEARRDFLQKQANLAAYQDANRGIITATGRATEARFRSEYDIAFTIYNELAKQREQAQLSVKEEKPVLTVINPVIVPLQKSEPNTSRIIMIWVLLGLLLSSVWVFVAPFVKEIINETTNYNESTDT